MKKDQNQFHPRTLQFKTDTSLPKLPPGSVYPQMSSAGPSGQVFGPGQGISVPGGFPNGVYGAPGNTFPPVQMPSSAPSFGQAFGPGQANPPMPVGGPSPASGASGNAFASKHPAVIKSPPANASYKASGKRSSRRKKRNGLLIGVMASIVAVLSVMAFSLWNMVANTTPDVTLYKVNAGNVSQYVGGGGIIFPRQQLDVSYPVAERVVAVLVKAGDQVTPNQPLIQLDPAQLNAQITQAANDLAAAQAYLNTVTANGNALLIAQAQQAYDFAKNKYNALVAEASSPLLHHGALISPMKGVVTSVNINSGEVFAANTSLLTVMDESTVVVHVKIPLANLGQVHRGQPAIVTPSALPNLNVNGTVSAIVPQADPQTDTFEVWVEVANPDDMLLPGMSAFVRIQSGVHALIVPRLAVLNSDRDATVFVVRDQHAHLQRVHLTGRSVNSIFIDAGLSVGDMIVLVGLDRLQDGLEVHVTRIEG